MRVRTMLIVTAVAFLPSLLTGVKAEPPGEVIYGEKLDPSDCGPGIIETMEEALARVAAMEADPMADPKARRGQHGTWAVPSKRATYYPHSGLHNAVNKWGDTRMGIGFPMAVDVHGAYFAGQGGKGAWAPGVRAIGYRHGQEVARTDWFREIGSVPAWFEMDLRGIDRLVIEAEAGVHGGGWYGLDDLTYTRKAGAGQSQPATVVLDFEDTIYGQKLTGTGYHGLTWETGTGDFKRDQDVIPAPRTVPGQEGGPSAGPVGAPTLRGLGTEPQLLGALQGVVRGDAGQWSAPPDSCGAIGPNHYVETVNTVFAVWDTSTSANVLMTPLSTLLPGGSGDPRVLFDQHSGRWIALDTDFTTEIFLSVSLTDDPTGSWFKTQFTASQGSDTGCWPDYPALGVDADGIYITANMFSMCGVTIFVIDKAPLIAPSPSLDPPTAFRSQQGGTIQPVHTYGNPGGEYLISQWTTDQLYLRFVQGPMTSPSMTVLGTIDVNLFAFPPDVPALGSDPDLDSVDWRLMNAVYRDGSIWTTHSIAGGAGTCCAWYQIDAATKSVVQWGTVTDPLLHYWMPSIMVNVRGDVVMGFSGSNADQYAACYYTGRLVDDPPGEVADPVLLKVGTGPHNIIDGFGRNRWGDYSLCSLDPNDELTIWTIQEYGHGTNIWGTYMGGLQYWFDCNNNTSHDYLDISGGTSPDTNTDGIPDECQVTRLHVDASASGGNSGITWADAYTSLVDALNTAAGSGVAEEVWVAGEGPYRPDQGTGDRTKSFNLVSGISVYGGFSGGESSLGDRPAGSRSVLSGDLNGDDAAVGNGENSYNVVWAEDADSTAVLDGFRIIAGNSDGGFPHSAGGGVYIDGGGPTLVNCVIEGNEAATGGGMFVTQAAPQLTGCTFLGNTAPGGGGAAYLLSADATLTACKLLGNTSGGIGGGLLLLGSSADLTMVNCLLSGNQAATKGGAVYDLAPGLATLINCSVSGNSAGGSGGGLYLNTSTAAQVSNCILYGNTDTGGNDQSAQIHVAGSAPEVNYSCVQGLSGGLGGTGNIGDDPAFEDPDGADGQYGTADDDAHLQAGSPCIDVGDNTAVPGGVTTDLDGNARFVDDLTTPDGGSGTPPIVDLGAYEAPSAGEASILTAASLLDHGGMELALDLIPNNIEPRGDGVLKLEFGVSASVSSVDAAVSCVNNVYAGSITVTAADTTVTVEFAPALPDQDCCEITLSGDVSDSFAVRTLKGDTTRNGITNTTDASQIKLLFGVSAYWAGAQFDYNTDGIVNATDFSQIKLNFEHSAPTCP